MELITIVINVYNCEKYINKCLECIVNQTYKNLEILIINDGSTDNTLSICRKYKDPRIRIKTTENLGLSLSRNVGIDNAKGEYLYFIDADDFIEVDTIEYLYKLIKKYNVDIATCKSMDIYNYDYEVKNKKEKVVFLSNKEMLIKILLFQDRAVAFWNKLIKKELFNDLRFEDRIINDLSYTYKLVLKSETIIFSNQIKHYYLRHSESITGKKESMDRIKDQYDVLYQRYNYIKKIYPKLIENNICILQNIIKLYIRENNQIESFLVEQNSFSLYKQVFSFKIIKSRINIREKIKIILFRVSPDLCKETIKLYLKIKKWWLNESKSKCHNTNIQ